MSIIKDCEGKPTCINYTVCSEKPKTPESASDSDEKDSSWKKQKFYYYPFYYPLYYIPTFYWG